MLSRTTDYLQTMDSKGQSISQEQHTAIFRRSCLLSGGEIELCR